MDITNKTRKPISLPLPGGKKLFLGPGKTGQIAPKAAEHPPVAKLIEAGDLEVASGGGGRNSGGGHAGKINPGRGSVGEGGIRKYGDG